MGAGPWLVAQGSRLVPQGSWLITRATMLNARCSWIARDLVTLFASEFVVWPRQLAQILERTERKAAL